MKFLVIIKVIRTFVKDYLMIGHASAKYGRKLGINISINVAIKPRQAPGPMGPGACLGLTQFILQTLCIR
jgi:hypothetical protein